MYELLVTTNEEHELMVTVVVATMYGDVVTIGADDVWELLGFTEVKINIIIHYKLHDRAIRHMYI